RIVERRLLLQAELGEAPNGFRPRRCIEPEFAASLLSKKMPGRIWRRPGKVISSVESGPSRPPVRGRQLTGAWHRAGLNKERECDDYELRGLREPTKIRASRVLLSADSDLWNSEKKAPPTKRGQGTAVRGLLGGEFPAPRAGPQIAYVELVPWSVR